MKIKLNKISIKNFKSIENIELKLNNLNILIGANDAGKSNFIEIFRFLSDFFEYGNEAWQKRDGFNTILCFFNKDSSISFKMEGEIENKFEFRYFIEFKSDKIKPYVNIETFNMRRNEPEWMEIFKFVNLEKTFFNPVDKNGKIKDRTSWESKSLYTFSPLLSEAIKINAPFILEFFNYFRNLGYFHLPTFSLQKSFKISEDLRLADNGKNLAVVLQNFSNEYQSDFQKLIEVLKELYPQYHTLKLKLLATNELLFYLEDFKKNKYFSWMLSDGLIKCIGFLYLCYSPDMNSFYLIEEPESSIQPHLLHRIFEMLRMLSNKKQIFITTHSPYFLNYSNIENLIYIYKKDGKTKAIRLEEAKIPKDLILEFKMGELYYSGELDPEKLDIFDDLEEKNE